MFTKPFACEIVLPNRLNSLSSPVRYYERNLTNQRFEIHEHNAKDFDEIKIVIDLVDVIC